MHTRDYTTIRGGYVHVAYIYVKKIIIHRAKAAVDDTYAMVVTTINNYVSAKNCN